MKKKYDDDDDIQHFDIQLRFCKHKCIEQFGSFIEINNYFISNNFIYKT